MAWTYDSADLDSSTASGRLNVVRLLVGDTNTTDQQVQDEEISFALSESGNNVYYTGSWISRSLAGKYSREVNINLDDQIQVEYKTLVRQYLSLAETLEYQAKKSSGGLGMVAGGISRTDMESNRSLEDRMKPSFRRDQFLNPPDQSYYDPQD